MVATLSAWIALVLCPTQDLGQGNLAPMTTFRAVMGEMAWDASAKGPLITVCPPTPHPAGTSIDALGLKLVQIGEVCSFVPRQMTTINTRFPPSPNLYEGLPTNTKILYLLTLLQPDQWKLIGKDGISLADCRGEQRAVLEAILPRPFSYERGIAELDSFGSSSDGGVRQEILTDEERAEVRLKVRRQVVLNIPFTEGDANAHAYAFRDFADRQEAAYVNAERQSRFGHQLLINGENRLRPTHLDLDHPAFDQKIPLIPDETVGALVTRIGNRVGRELYSAPAFDRYQLVVRGPEASARDILKCILLGCTGVFRRVGPAYELTNDLEGMAAHNAKLLAWLADLTLISREREAEWRSQIRPASGISSVPLAGNALQKLSPAELANLNENDRGAGPFKYVSTGGGSPEIVKSIEGERSDGHDLDLSRVAMSSELKWTLSLPNGLESCNPGYLGKSPEFGRKPSLPWQPEATEPVDLPMKNPRGLQGLVVRPLRPEDAETLVQLVSRLGLKELWVETEQAAALEKAISVGKLMGVDVRLAINPFASGDAVSAAEVDRNATGIFGPALDYLEHSFLSVQRYFTNEMRYPRARRATFAPAAASTRMRMATLTPLAKTPNLAGVSILDAYPRGYHLEPGSSRTYGPYNSDIRELFDLGYSENQRLEFLRKYKVDPLDLCSQDDAGLFSMKVWGGQFGGFNDDLNDKWQRAKAYWAKRAVDSLLTSLYDAKMPLLVAAQPDRSPRIDPPEVLYQWNPDLGHLAEPSIPAPAATLLRIADDESPERRARVANSLKRLLKSAQAPVYLDLTEIKPVPVAKVISEWLSANPRSKREATMSRRSPA